MSINQEQSIRSNQGQTRMFEIIVIRIHKTLHYRNITETSYDVYVNKKRLSDEDMERLKNWAGNNTPSDAKMRQAFYDLIQDKFVESDESPQCWLNPGRVYLIKTES